MRIWLAVLAGAVAPSLELPIRSLVEATAHEVTEPVAGRARTSARTVEPEARVPRLDTKPASEPRRNNDVASTDRGFLAAGCALVLSCLLCSTLRCSRAPDPVHGLVMVHELEIESRLHAADARSGYDYLVEADGSVTKPGASSIEVREQRGGFVELVVYRDLSRAERSAPHVPRLTSSAYPVGKVTCKCCADVHTREAVAVQDNGVRVGTATVTAFDGPCEKVQELGFGAEPLPFLRAVQWGYELAAAAGKADRLSTLLQVLDAELLLDGALAHFTVRRHAGRCFWTWPARAGRGELPLHAVSAVRTGPDRLRVSYFARAADHGGEAESMELVESPEDWVRSAQTMVLALELARDLLDHF